MADHRAYGGRAKEHNNIWWHGSVSGDMRGGKTGLHLGTRAAAEDALHASIGFPAEGTWDGTREYYKTLLAGKKRIKEMNPYGITGRNVDAPDEDYYAHEHPSGPLKYSNGDPVPMDVRPFIKPFRITGGMTNAVNRPHGDWKANGYMAAALKKGNAKNGYFYKNEGEDAGSISAVVPGPGHIQPVDKSEITKADGGEVSEPGITAYHASPLQLKEFKPSGFRGSTFFASTPKRAVEGAGAGANEMVMDTATELKRGPMFIHRVQINPSHIQGLHYTPKEKQWFSSLPPKIVGDDALENVMRNSPNPYIGWDDIYDHKEIGDRLYEYTKRKAPPSITYEDAYKTGRDVYGQQHSHYGSGANEKGAAERVLKHGMKGYLIHDEAGLSIAMADPSHAKIKEVKQFADGGAIDDGSEGITAYHGSPHDFEHFDMSKIGTGEGNQSYGHGLYFAEHEPIAKGYRDDLTHETVHVDGSRINPPTQDDPSTEHVYRLANLMYQLGHTADQEIDYAIARAEKLKPNLSHPDHYKRMEAEKAQKWVETILPYRGKKIEWKQDPGHMYEVHINAHPDHFLDWDKSFHDQTEHVRNSLMSVPNFEDMGHYKSGLTMGELINRGLIPHTYDKASPEFSKAYHAAGIKGVKYLDQGSRWGGKKDPTRNYVVFDDKLVNIKRKYEQGGTVGGYKDGGKVSYHLKPDDDDRKHSGYQKTGGRMTWISPDKFLSQTQKMDMDKGDKESIERFERKMENGKELNPLAIFPSGGQDGRHRAMAAKHEGIKKVPVIQWDKRARGGSIVDRALMITSKKA